MIQVKLHSCDDLIFSLSVTIVLRDVKCRKNFTAGFIKHYRPLLSWVVLLTTKPKKVMSSNGVESGKFSTSPMTLLTYISDL